MHNTAAFCTIVMFLPSSKVIDSLFMSGILGDIIDLISGHSFSTALEKDLLKQILSSVDRSDAAEKPDDSGATSRKATNSPPFETTATIATIDDLVANGLVKEKDDKHVVGWYDDHDPANPRNWPLHKKSLVSAQIYVYTFAVYMGGAIFANGEEGMMEEFGVGHISAAWASALYLVGYGVGPLLF